MRHAKCAEVGSEAGRLGQSCEKPQPEEYADEMLVRQRESQVHGSMRSPTMLHTSAIRR